MGLLGEPVGLVGGLVGHGGSCGLCRGCVGLVAESRGPCGVSCGLRGSSYRSTRGLTWALWGVGGLVGGPVGGPLA